MTKREIARAARLYRQGRTLREIAAELGYDKSGSHVWRYIRDRVEVRRIGPRGRVDVPDDLILALRDEEQMSWPAIAKEVGMSRTGVRARYMQVTTGTRWR